MNIALGRKLTMMNLLSKGGHLYSLLIITVAATKMVSVSSFLVTNNYHILSEAPKLKLTVDDNDAQISLPAAPSIIDSIPEEQPSQTQQQFELWLDLRQTTISPQAALLHLTNDLWDEYVAPENKSFLVDKVLVNALDEKNMIRVIDDIKDEYEEEIQVLFENDGVITSMATLDFDSEDSDSDEGEETDFSVQDQGCKFPIYDDETGLINVYSNPMPALEAISSGEWLVLDSSLGDKEQRREAIQSLVELCNGSLNVGVAISGKNGDDKERGRPCKGGIVIDCSSSAEIFEAGAMIKSLSGNQEGYETTDSGILVQSAQDKDVRTTLPVTSQSEPIKYAILVPLDALLWKTASFVIRSDGMQSMEEY